jgi:RNA polymerase sigma-70 factor (ECF subfamily)
MLEQKNITGEMADRPAGQVKRQPLNERENGRSVEPRSDDTLIVLFQNGDRQAFRELVERHQERVRNLIYSIFHEREVIDDLAQEVFMKVYEALPNFRFESSFYTWVYRIAVNKSRDELRKRKIRRFFSLQSMMDSSDPVLKANTIEHPKEEESKELVRKGLTMLPEKFREAIILKDIEGFSYEEIAEIMQCEVGTVKSRLSRGRTMLRKVLKPFLEDR